MPLGAYQGIGSFPPFEGASASALGIRFRESAGPHHLIARTSPRHVGTPRESTHHRTTAGTGTHSSLRRRDRGIAYERPNVPSSRLSTAEWIRRASERRVAQPTPGD